MWTLDQLLAGKRREEQAAIAKVLTAMNELLIEAKKDDTARTE